MKHPFSTTYARPARHITGKHGKPLSFFTDKRKVTSNKGYSRRRMAQALKDFKEQELTGTTTPPVPSAKARERIALRKKMGKK